MVRVLAHVCLECTSSSASAISPRESRQERERQRNMLVTHGQLLGVSEVFSDRQCMQAIMHAAVDADCLAQHRTTRMPGCGWVLHAAAGHMTTYALCAPAGHMTTVD